MFWENLIMPLHVPFDPGTTELRAFKDLRPPEYTAKNTYTGIYGIIYRVYRYIDLQYVPWAQPYIS